MRVCFNAVPTIGGGGGGEGGAFMNVFEALFPLLWKKIVRGQFFT